MKKKKYLLVAIFSIFMLGGLYAQPGGGGVDEGGKGPGAPIDGGIAILVIAGIGYGVKKYKEL